MKTRLRRRLLAALCVYVLLVTACSSLPSIPSLPSQESGSKSAPSPTRAGAVVESIPPAEVQAGDWLQTSDADFNAGTLQDVQITKNEDGEIALAGAGTGVYTSTVKRMEPFTAVGTRLVADVPQGSSVTIQVRTSTNNTAYSGWQDVAFDNEAGLNSRSTVTTTSQSQAQRIAGELVVLQDTNLYLQYRITLHAADQSKLPVVREVILTGINSRGGPTVKEAALSVTTQVIGAPPVISRAGWGANERYRMDDKNEEVWKPEYERPTKFIIHHTVTPNQEENPPATVRAIYYYHAVTLGWGDIGYNYLIDWKGNIYEGRYGGENVIGGHAYGHNNGSIGIALLGTYTTTQITKEAEQALVKLIAWKADELQIDPLGSSFFVDHDTPNIMGHRDAMPGETTCPGDALYAQLPAIREEVKTHMSSVGVKFTAQADNAWVGGPDVNVSAVATATNGIGKVELFLDDTPRASGTSDTITYTWDTTNWTEGAHTFKAVVTDKQGKIATSTRTLNVDNTPAVFSSFTYTNSVAGVQVQDKGSGLAVNSAQYQINDGKAWGDWQSIQLNASAGTTNTETLSVTNLSANAKQIRFRINDLANITAYSPAYVLSGGTPQIANGSQAQWYFAEGSTTKGFDTWLLIQNPNPAIANVTVNYHKTDGSVIERSYKVAPSARLSIWVDKEVPNADVAMVVTADRQVYAERAMYSGHDGSSSIGTSAPSKTWYFAEGFTGAGFDTWLLLFNPNSTPANVRVTYVRDNGQTVDKQYTVLPNARMSIWANKEVPNASLSFILNSDQPVVAERSMYFDPHRQASHNSMGVTAPAKTWYLAEGTTSPPYDTWILLLNPNKTEAKVKLTYYKTDGTTQIQDVTVSPTSRLSIWANKVVTKTAFATKVESDQDIVVERSMYFTGSGGSNSFGITEPGTLWYHPEGSTNPTFNTFFLILNPNPVPATLRVTFMREDGITTIRQYTVEPNSRFTIWANRELPPLAFSTMIESDQPVVSERATYFQDNTGGTNSNGIMVAP